MSADVEQELESSEKPEKKKLVSMTEYVKASFGLLEDFAEASGQTFSEVKVEGVEKIKPSEWDVSLSYVDPDDQNRFSLAGGRKLRTYCTVKIDHYGNAIRITKDRD